MAFGATRQADRLKRLDDIDWVDWNPVDRATLVFLVDNERILLIRKKRGLGAGKINGPGGRVEKGETAWVCAAREMEEEVGLEPLDLEALAELRFQFVDGYSIHVIAFRATRYRGQLKETEEAIPLWTELDQIPWQEMWQDDQHWLSFLIEQKPVVGKFLFKGDCMIGYRLLPADKDEIELAARNMCCS